MSRTRRLTTQPRKPLPHTLSHKPGKELSTMSGNAVLHSRFLFVSLLVCAAVISFIMRSDAAIASPRTTRPDNGVNHNILSSLFTPYNQHNPLSTGLLPPETRSQTGTNVETEKSRNYGEALSIIDHQSHPLRFTEGSFSYNQNSPDNRQLRAGVTRVLRGHGAGGVRPASSIFTVHSQYGGQSFEGPQSGSNYHPLSQKVAQTGNSYNSYNCPFHQSSGFSQAWDPRDAQKCYNEVKVPEVKVHDSPKLATDRTSWPLQAGEYWSASLPAPRGHKGINELAAVRAHQSTSRGIQSSKFFGFASQTAPHAPSISNGLDTSVIRHYPSPEKVTSSVTDFSQGLNSVTSGEKLRPKKVQSYLFKDSHTSFEAVNTVTGGGQEALSGRSGFTTMPTKRMPSDSQVYSRFASNFKGLHRKDPTKGENANPLNPKLSESDSFTKYQLISSIYPPAHLSLHPTSGKGRTTESFVPIPHAASQDSYAAGSGRSVVGSPVNATTRGSLHGYKPGQSAKSIYGIRGFKNPLWSAVKKPSIPRSGERTNSKRFSFDKRKDYKFKIANIYPSLSPKYSFGQRGAPTTTTTTPAKLGGTPTDYLPPSSPSSFGLIQTTTVSPPMPFTPGFKNDQSLLPESDFSMDNNPHHIKKIYNRIYGLKGFGTRPLEGAKTLVRKPDKSATLKQGFEGFQLRSSHIWQPKSSSNRIHKWYNRTAETELETSNTSTQSQNKPGSEDFRPLPKTAGGTESVEHSGFTPDKYNRNRKFYSFLGFQSNQNRARTGHEKTQWKYGERNPTRVVSSAYLRPAGGLKAESRPTSESKMPSGSKPVAMKASLFNRATSSMVRGKRVKGKRINSTKLNESTSLTSGAVNVAIVRLPKRPAGVKAVTYADILGSASFSGVRATTQTTADKEYFPNTTATTKQKEGGSYSTLSSDDGVQSRANTSGGPEANTEDEVVDFSSVEEKTLGFKSRELDCGMKTCDALLDNEGSGSGFFNLPDVLSPDATRAQGLEDLSELDYLRISTGNISFKSVKLSEK